MRNNPESSTIKHQQKLACKSSIQMLSDFLCVKKYPEKDVQSTEGETVSFKIKSSANCVCFWSVSVACGIEFLPHFCESHELSSSVNTISVCCWEFAPGNILLVSTVHGWVCKRNNTIVSSVSFVGHCNALHKICVDNLTIGRWKESRWVNITSNQVVDIRERLLFDRDDILSTGCVCGVQSGCNSLQSRFGELLIWNCR